MIKNPIISMFFRSHKTFYAIYETYKMPENKQLNIGSPVFSVYSFVLLSSHLTLAGPPIFMLTSACTDVHIGPWYLIKNDMCINIHVLLQEFRLNTRQREQIVLDKYL